MVVAARARRLELGGVVAALWGAGLDAALVAATPPPGVGPGARAAADTFVAVDIVTLTGTTPIEVVTRSGRHVTVPRGFDEEHLARLLQVLDAGC